MVLYVTRLYKTYRFLGTNMYSLYSRRMIIVITLDDCNTIFNFVKIFLNKLLGNVWLKFLENSID